MRIECISVDGFGVWHDTRIEPDPGLTVVLGPNEAGKTTLLAFVRSMLFGFETNRYPALGGGRRGGWLDVRTVDDRRFRIERYGDRGGDGNLRVVDEDDVDRGSAALRRILHNVEASVYRNVFAFRLEELTEFRGLTEGEVASRIYGAGLGTGATSALAIESGLRNEAGGLFKSGGQNPLINVLLREVEEIDRQLDGLDLPAEYAAAARRLAQREADRTEQAWQVERLDAERRALERVCAGWEPWLSLRAAEDRLAALPDVGSIPSDAPARLAGLAQARRDAEEAINGIVRRRRRLEEALAAATPDQALLAAAARIERVAAAREGERARNEALVDARSESVVADRRAQDAVAALGPGWDADRVNGLDTSVPVRSAISGRFRDRLDGARRTLERASDEVTGAEARLAEAERAVSSIEAQLGEGADLDVGTLEARERELIEQEMSLRATGGTRGMATRDRRVAVAALMGMGLVIALLIFAMAGDPLVGLLAAALGGVAATGFWSWARLTRPGVGADEIERLRRDLLDTRRSAARADGLAAQLTEITERRESAVRAAEAARGRVGAAEAALAEATAEWADWLRARDLPADLERESALALLEAAAAARVELRRRDDATRSVERLEAGSTAFVAEAFGLLRELGRPEADPARIGAEVDRLAALLAESRQAERDRRRLTTEIAEVGDEQAGAAERLSSAQAELDALLTACGATSLVEARRRAEVAEERRQHEEAAASARAALVALSGPREALERLVAEIGAVAEIAERRDRVEGIRTELEEAAAGREAAAEEIGGLHHELRRLEASVASSELRQRRADLVARLEAEAERWAVRSLAVELLKRTRSDYEREHRPGVVRAAEQYLAEWTAGRYTQIVAPLGGTIEGLERSDRRRIPLAGLSRGTAEQLYLALRFGLIEHFAEEAEPLPIVMDEILVNFDEERATRAARSIEALSQRHQILYFTYREDHPLHPGATVRLQPPPLAVGAQPAGAAAPG
ncbi:MAG: AAA family ATPase [Candidatus Limnocylindria bacterium]